MSLAGSSSHQPQTVEHRGRRAASERGEPPEPFGQRGVRQYIVPTISLLSLAVSCVSVAMWIRSFSTIDMLSREAGFSSWRARSVIGRVLLYRIDWSPDSFRGYDHDDTGWRYSTESIRDLPPDGWAETWKKRIGVEWQNESLYPGPAIAGGLWLRVRWRTVALAFAILPVVRTMRHHLRRRIAVTN